MRFYVLFLSLVILLSSTAQVAMSFNVPPKGGLCYVSGLGDCRRCECVKGLSCRKGKCV